MKETKFTYLFLIFILVSTLYSQVKKELPELRNEISNPEFLERNPPKDYSHIMLKSETFDSTTVIDSVIVNNIDRSRKKYTYTYEPNGNVTSYLRESWNDSRWVNVSRETYTYNSNGNMTSSLSEYLDDGNWVNYEQITYTYDSNGNMTLFLSEEWDGSNWVNFWQVTYTYDSKGNMTFKLYEEWDISKWRNTLRRTYTYNSKGNMTSYLFEQWGGNNWRNISQDIYTYDPNGNMTLNTRAKWDESNWVNCCRFTYTYDSNENMTSYLFENWDSSNWRNISRDTYTYDLSGNMTLDLHEDWDENNWLQRGRTTYFYDINGNMISGLYESWDGSTWITFIGDFSLYDSFGRNYFFYGSEINVFYRIITDVAETNFAATDFSLSQNYPNPFNPSTAIKYSIPSSQTPLLRGVGGVLVTLKVYDVLGREVATLVNEQQNHGEYKVVFEASKLPSGTYFYRLTAGDFNKTKKLLLLK